MNETLKEFLDVLKFPKPDIKICIETGSWQGMGAKTLRQYFDKVYSVELSLSLHEHCVKNNTDLNTQFFQGESDIILKKILPTIKDKYALFLDAHGSGGDTAYANKVGRYGSPVLQEIEACVSNPPEIIMIDDFSDFETINTYPKEDEITNKVQLLGNYNKSIIRSHKGLLVFERQS